MVYSLWSIVYGLRIERMLRVILLTVLLVSQVPYPAFVNAEMISSRELIDSARSLDGNTVTYRGEAVTAIMHRVTGSWVNVHDGYNAIGIWCDRSILASVERLGGYKSKGDILEVEGVFNRACGIHNGDLDIHAVKAKIIGKGYSVEERISSKRLTLSFILFFAVLAVTMVFRRRI